MVTDTSKCDKTNIQISLKNRERLIKLGSKNDSYDDILDRVLDEYEKLHASD